MAKKKSQPAAPRAKSKSPFALAAVVSDRVQIRDVRVIESHAKQSPRPPGDRRRFQATNKVEVDYALDVDQEEIAVLPRFIFLAYDGEPGGSEPAVSIECVLSLTYAAPGLSELPKSNIKAFAHTNGVFNAWPYWREFVQSTAARMGIPNLVIPVFRFGEA